MGPSQDSSLPLRPHGCCRPVPAAGALRVYTGWLGLRTPTHVASGGRCFLGWGFGVLQLFGPPSVILLIQDHRSQLSTLSTSPSWTWAEQFFWSVFGSLFISSCLPGTRDTTTCVKTILIVLPSYVSPRASDSPESYFLSHCVYMPCAPSEDRRRRPLVTLKLLDQQSCPPNDSTARVSENDHLGPTQEASLSPRLLSFWSDTCVALGT